MSTWINLSFKIRVSQNLWFCEKKNGEETKPTQSTRPWRKTLLTR